jgi:bacillithiol system protein YtxJ
MLNWNVLNDVTQLDALAAQSHELPVLIFKHSTTCPISHAAKSRLETKWDFAADAIAPYYLDLLSFRAVSNEIAAKFGVHHESPQAILLHNGEVIYDDSHLDISVAALHQGIEAIA